LVTIKLYVVRKIDLEKSYIVKLSQLILDKSELNNECEYKNYYMSKAVVKISFKLESKHVNNQFFTSRFNVASFKFETKHTQSLMLTYLGSNQ
jgi:hypothetical protein